jgi:hypothetical protein
MAKPRDAALRLTCVSDDGPGIRRVRRGGGFAYLRPDGTPLGARSADARRIARLAIPPAWRDVWICPRPDGHLQATGRDARGRKRYRYHDAWREARGQEELGRRVEVGRQPRKPVREPAKARWAAASAQDRKLPPGERERIARERHAELARYRRVEERRSSKGADRRRVTARRSSRAASVRRGARGRASPGSARPGRPRAARRGAGR